MINFRFHLLSLVAVFLALALGIVMGSTVIDRAIVDTLRNRIDRVEENANARQRENDELRGEVDRLDDYIESTAPFAVTGRLDGVPLAVVATRDTDADPVTSTVTLAQSAGARAGGVLWLEEKWVRPDDAAREELAEILGETTTDPEDQAAAAWAALAERLAAGAAPAESDVLVALGDAGFVGFEQVGEQETEVGTFPGEGARVLLVDDSDSDVESEAVIIPAVQAFVNLETPLVVAEVFEERSDGPERGSRVAPVRSDEQLAQAVSTVDNLDMPEGRVALVLATSDLGRNIVGQYGYGSGATSSVPDWVVL